MELSIDDLLAGLQEAQEAKSTVKLSERNVVELVNKLKQLDLLTELLYTVNGKEYITKDRVQAEVAAGIRSAGGRIALVDLPPMLGVDLVHCEAAASRIAEESGGETLMAQGEIITSQYFDNLAKEVDEELQEAGVVALPELARKSHLSADLLLSSLSARMGTTIRGRMEGGLLYTQAHVARIKARLRGALRGCTAPTLVPDLLAKVANQMADGAFEVDPKLVATVVEELLQEQGLKGSIKGGGTSWVPDIYKTAQAEAVKTFFEQNGYIDFDHAAKMGLPTPSAATRSELSTLLPEALALSTALVSPVLVDQLEASVEEVLSSGSWLDVLPLVPSVLSVEDAGTLLGRCPSAKALVAAATGKGQQQPQGSRVVASTCVVSAAFLKELRERYRVEARAAASAAAAERRTHAAAAAAGGAPDQPSGKGGKAAKGKKEPEPADADDDDDWDLGKKGKKGGKKGGKGKGGGGSGKGKASGGGGGGAAAASSEEQDISKLRAPTASKISQRLQEWFPELAEPAGDSDVLADELATEVLPSAVAEYEKALTAAFTAGSEERRRRRDDIAKLLETAAAQLVLFGKGAQLIAEGQGEEQQGDEPADEVAVAVERHIIRTAGAEAVDLLLRYEELHCDDVVLPEDPRPVLGLTPAERKAIIARLPGDLRGSSTSITEALGGASLSELQTSLEEAAEAAGLRLKRHDKRAEKAAVADFQRKLVEKLQPESDPAAALALAVPLLFAKITGRILSVPGKVMTGVISRLEPAGLPEADRDMVLGFHQDVVAYLKSKNADGADQETFSRLEEALPKLKAICGTEE